MEEPVHTPAALEAHERKRAVDTILLLFVPAMLLMSYLAQLLSRESPIGLFGWNALLVEGLVVFLPAYLYMRKHGGLKAYGFVRISAGEWLSSLIMGVGIFFFVTAINAVFVIFWTLLGFHQQGTPVPSGTPLEVLLSLIFVAAVPAIAEETLFRGALFRCHMRYGMKRAILHTSLLFAMAHFQLITLPALFIAGLLFTYVSRVTGSVYSPMAMHFSYNGSAVVLSTLASDFAAEQTERFVADDLQGAFDGQLFGMGGIAMVILIIIILIIIVLYAGLGFGVGYPAYRTLVRSSARRFGIEISGVRFRELKAAVLLHVDGMNTIGADETAQPPPDTPDTPDTQDTPATELDESPAHTGLGWRAALTYVLMGGVALLFLLISRFS